MEKIKLISRVKFPKSVIYIGEPLEIKVTSNINIIPKESIDIYINGFPGARQYLQYATPGRKQIIIIGSTPSKRKEKRIIQIEVLERIEKGDRKNLFPVIGVSQNFLKTNSATFSVDNIEEFKNLKVYFIWEFGNKNRYLKSTSTIEYSFDKYLNPNAPYTNFDIKVHVKTVDNTNVYTGVRTITVWNNYYINKRKGFIQLKVRPEIYANIVGKNYVGEFTITNIESESIVFGLARIEYLIDEPNKNISPESSINYDFTIGSKETLNKTFSVPVNEFPKNAFGFAAHLKGKTRKSKLDAFAHVYFEIRTDPKKLIVIKDLEIRELLKNIRNSKTLPNKNIIHFTELKNAIDKKKHEFWNLPPSLEGFLQRDGKAIDNIAKSFDLPPMTKHLEGELPDPVLGAICTWEDEANPRNGMVCQIIENEDPIQYEIPAKILNAKKGDVFLTPSGEDSPVGLMLQEVDPPQRYDHCGIMVSNYYRLRHSKPSMQWLLDAKEPNWLKDGLSGLIPEKLKYIWPGTITQSAEEGFNGSIYPDPDGIIDEDTGEVKQYRMYAFNNRSVGLVNPIILKPFHDNPEIRQILHRIADSASEINGHYRFYCYTDASIFYTDHFKAPEKGWMAEKPFPTVCSSLIWAAVKRLSDPIIQIEDSGNEDLWQDGLVDYTEDERINAANKLWEWVQDKVRKELYSAGIPALRAILSRIPNQICNTFAFDWSGINEQGEHSINSDRWKHPGGGIAVSPEDISNWPRARMDEQGYHGLYGYSEPLVYRSSRFEERRISRWVEVEVEQSSRLRVQVLYDGNPVSRATVNPGALETDERGECELELPAGTYLIGAGALIGNFFMETNREITLNPNEVKNIILNLQEPSQLFRDISIEGEIRALDDDSTDPFGKDDRGFKGINRMISLGPPPNEWMYSYDKELKVDDEVRVDLHLDIFLDRSTGSVAISYFATLWEGTSADTHDPDDRMDFKSGLELIPMDESGVIDIDLESEGGDRGSIYLTIWNLRADRIQ